MCIEDESTPIITDSPLDSSMHSVESTSLTTADEKATVDESITIHPSNETSEINGNTSNENNSSNKNKSKQVRLIVGVVVAAVALIAVVLVLLFIKKRSNIEAPIKTDEISGEMPQEDKNDGFKAKSSNAFDSSYNPFFSLNTEDHPALEDTFMNDFEEGRM